MGLTMTSLAAAILEHIAGIAPVSGVSVGIPSDPSTWRIDFHPSATEQQKGDASTALAAFDPLVCEKRRLQAAVDATAEETRLLFLTPGSGMMMTYQEKFAQAGAVQAMGEAAANGMSQLEREEQFPTLAASVGIEGPTLWACAQLVLTKYTEFAQLSGVIERTRLAGKRAISDASDAAGVRAAYEAITWPTP